MRHLCFTVNGLSPCSPGLRLYYHPVLVVFATFSRALSRCDELMRRDFISVKSARSASRYRPKTRSLFKCSHFLTRTASRRSRLARASMREFLCFLDHIVWFVDCAPSADLTTRCFIVSLTCDWPRLVAHPFIHGLLLGSARSDHCVSVFPHSAK